MGRRMIDLTFPVHEGMQTFPVHWHPMVEITQLGRFGIENRETRKLVLGTHTGTHCDAPRHFVPDGSTVDEIPLQTLIGPALVLDLSAVADGAAIGVDDMASRLAGRHPERLVLRYDWCRHWGTRAYYRDHPFLTEDAARLLVDHGVRLLAMDTPMPDNPMNGSNSLVDSPNHKILLGNGVVLVEYLCNLRLIQSEWVDLIALPLKIKGGDGSPARAVAIDHAAPPAGNENN